MAQTRENGGGPPGSQRLRALDDDRFPGPDARFQPGTARRSVAVAAAAVRAARFPVASADRLPELLDATRRAQPVVDKVTAVSAAAPAAPATADHRHAAVVVVIIAVRVVVNRVHRHRPQDVVHSGAPAQGQGTRRVHYQGHANGLNATRPNSDSENRPPRRVRC